MADVENINQKQNSSKVANPDWETLCELPEAVQQFCGTLFNRVYGRDIDTYQFYEEGRSLIEDLQMGVDSRTGESYGLHTLVRSTPEVYAALALQISTAAIILDVDFGNEVYAIQRADLEARINKP